MCNDVAYGWRETMPTRMKRTQILLPEDQYRRLQRIAQERQCSLGHLVREAVAQTTMSANGSRAGTRSVRVAPPRAGANADISVLFAMR